MKIRLGGLLIELESKIVVAGAQNAGPPGIDKRPVDSIGSGQIGLIRAGAQTLRPVIRFTTIRLMGAGQNAGGGIGFVRAQPVAVIARPAPAGAPRVEDNLHPAPVYIPIPDMTGRALGALVAAALGISLLLWLIRKRWSELWQVDNR